MLDFFHSQYLDRWTLLLKIANRQKIRVHLPPFFSQLFTKWQFFLFMWMVSTKRAWWNTTLAKKEENMWAILCWKVFILCNRFNLAASYLEKQTVEGNETKTTKTQRTAWNLKPWTLEKGNEPIFAIIIFRLHLSYLVVSTPLNNISQIGSFPHVGMNIKNIWNHHLVVLDVCLHLSQIILHVSSFPVQK